MIEKTCCVTGHRDITAGKEAYVKRRLNEEIEQAVTDGFTTFVSGFADGVDLLFAELVIRRKARYPYLRLEAAVPYSNRLNARNPLFQARLHDCDGVYVQQDEYSYPR